MSDFDPGEGWRKIDLPHPTETQWEGEVLHLANGTRHRYWLREESVPPLPTEPYTVIRVTWREGMGRGNDEVRHLNGDWEGLSASQLRERITGFEVLAEPRMTQARSVWDEQVRRETAKAVLDRVRSRVLGDTSWSRTGMDELAREFGVES